MSEDFPVSVIVIVSVFLLLSFLVVGIPVMTKEVFTATITVTDKDLWGSDHMRIQDGINEYRAPGFLWDDVKIGARYNLSGRQSYILIFGENYIPILEKDYWVTSIHEVGP